MPFGDTPAYDRGIDRGVMMPVGELITSALSNKGNPTGILQDNTFRVQNAQEVRIVDKNGEVLFSGIGPDAARQAVAVGQNLSDTLGNKAGWTIQTGERTINTDGSVGPMRYFDVANEKVNKSVLGKIADIALPVLGSVLVPGGGLLGTILPAAAGSAASSVAQGRSLGDTLLRAAIAGGGAGLGEGVFGQVVPAGNAVGQTASLAGDALANLPSLLDDIAATAAQNVASAGLGAATQAIAPSIAGDIIATAIRQPASAAISNIFPAVTGGISNTLLDRAISQPAQATQTQQPAQQEYAPPPEEIVLTAPQNILPPALTAPEALAASAAANALGSTVAQSPDVTKQMTPKEMEDVTGAGGVGGGLLSRLTANMGLTDYLTAASLLGSGVKSLFGGGGGGTTALPYGSPFGAGAGFGTGQDFRVNPNISDYERYGFGPEASFFAPGYSQLVSGAAGAPMQAPTTMGPQGAMINPQYVPLI